MALVNTIRAQACFCTSRPLIHCSRVAMEQPGDIWEWLLLEIFYYQKSRVTFFLRVGCGSSLLHGWSAEETLIHGCSFNSKQQGMLLRNLGIASKCQKIKSRRGENILVIFLLSWVFFIIFYLWLFFFLNKYKRLLIICQ